MNYELVEKNAERIEKEAEQAALEKEEKMRSLADMQAAINRLEGDAELIKAVQEKQDKKAEEVVEIDVRIGEMLTRLESLEQLHTEDAYKQISDLQTIEQLQSVGEDMSDALALIKRRQEKVNSNNERLKALRARLMEIADSSTKR